MSRWFLFPLLVLVAIPGLLLAQNPTASDPQAVSLAARAVATLTGSNVVSDVKLNATVTSVFGSDHETGTATFAAKGTSESRVDFSLSSGDTRSDVRNVTTGMPGGAWRKNANASEAYAGHNCWTDAAWFFPALSSLTQTGNANFIFKYIGQEQHGGVNTQHIRVYQASAVSLLQRLSTIDFYLDPASSLVLAIAFQVHPDKDAGRNIPAEVRFASYQSVKGVFVPYRIQKMLNGGVVLDITVSSVALNSGLPDSTFSLQ